MGYETPRDELLFGILLAVAGSQLGSIGVFPLLTGVAVGIGAYVEVALLGRDD